MDPSEFRRIRKGMGLSQQELAGKLGISRRTVIAMEAGSRTIGRRTEIAVLSMGMDYRELLIKYIALVTYIEGDCHLSYLHICEEIAFSEHEIESLRECLSHARSMIDRLG